MRTRRAGQFDKVLIVLGDDSCSVSPGILYVQRVSGIYSDLDMHPSMILAWQL